MRQCVFCSRPAKTKEHLWSDWILKGLALKTPIRYVIGRAQPKILESPDITVKCVCRDCNNGWMSSLEAANKPIIGCLMRDISAPLDTAQQTALALWAVKTAMVADAVRKCDRRFYERGECEQLRLSSLLPANIRVWLARYSGSALLTQGTDIWIAIPEAAKAGNGCASTIIVGHLAIQVLAFRVRPEYRDRAITVKPKPGLWEQLLVEIWPISSTVTWPPVSTFSRNGQFPIDLLPDRWKIGTPA